MLVTALKWYAAMQAPSASGDPEWNSVRERHDLYIDTTPVREVQQIQVYGATSGTFQVCTKLRLGRV